ncbi:MAG: hypothetical protein ABJO29_09000 [Yoonia sp.]|uniref:hypothetical protein n=1 Tax=Yoonia sp. TaxID=2212373 RepID=UPI0032636187
MTNQTKRGVAALVVAFCVVCSFCLLAIGRLAPQTFTPAIWITVLGLLLVVFGAAVVVLRKVKG